jgi:membrane protease YdiL (CAAX protease family)
MSNFRDIFLNPEDNRLRTGWRVAYYWVLFFGVYFAVGIITAFLPAIENLSDQVELLINSALLAIGFSVITWLARRRIDQRSFVSLGLEPKAEAWKDLGVGLLLGAVLIGLIFLIQFFAGWLTVEGTAFDDGLGDVFSILVTALVLFILVGYYEELVFRGYILQNLAEGAGLPWALVISSAMFGALHLINPNANLFTLASITGAGLMMAYGWIATRRLWLPIGLHIAWNFFQGAAFGFPVSGIGIEGVLQLKDNGPVWLTGGRFGPEGGLMVLPAMALGALAIWLYGRKSK